MRVGAPSDYTKKEIQAAFDAWAADPTQGVVSSAGFSSETQAAMAYAMANPSEDSMAFARATLRSQLNGTHAKRAAKMWDEVLAEFDM